MRPEILSFYLESFPIAASVFSDPHLLSRHRLALRERGAGPERLVEAVAAYLSAEQHTGRVAATARPEVVAELLVGACLHHAFLAASPRRRSAQHGSDDSPQTS